MNLDIQSKLSGLPRLLIAIPLAGTLLIATGVFLSWNSKWNIDVAKEFGAPQPVTPKPNAFDIYQVAFENFRPEPVDGIIDPKASSDQTDWAIRYPAKARIDWVTKQKKGWEWLRLANNTPCLFPTQLRDAGTDVIGLHRNLRQLARFKAVEAHARRDQGHYGAAMESAIDTFKMALNVPRGSNLVAPLVGMACEAIARKDAQITLPHLSGREAADKAQQLQGVLAHRDTFTSMVTSEKWASTIYFSTQLMALPASQYRAQRGSFSPIGFIIDYFVSPRSQVTDIFRGYEEEERLASLPWAQYRNVPEPSGYKRNPAANKILAVVRKTRFNYERAVALDNMLVIQLALHAYQQDYGKFPSELAALKGKYLKAIPIDPFAGKEMSYRPNGNSYVLWSFGPDAIDDAGRPAHNPEATHPRQTFIVLENSLGDIVAGNSR